MGERWRHNGNTLRQRSRPGRSLLLAMTCITPLVQLGTLATGETRRPTPAPRLVRVCRNCYPGHSKQTNSLPHLRHAKPSI